MLLFCRLVNSPYDNYCSHDTLLPETFRRAQNAFARLATRWRANQAIPLLNLQQIKVCSLRLIRLLLSRCAGSGGHYPSVSKRDRRSAATVPFSLSLVPMHQCHTGRVTAGRTESGGCGEGSAAAPHCDEADSMADWPTNGGGRSRRWPSDCCTDLTQVWITHLLNPLWGPRLDCNSLWILRYIY